MAIRVGGVKHKLHNNDQQRKPTVCVVFTKASIITCINQRGTAFTSLSSPANVRCACLHLTAWTW